MFRTVLTVMPAETERAEQATCNELSTSVLSQNSCPSQARECWINRLLHHPRPLLILLTSQAPTYRCMLVFVYLTRPTGHTRCIYQI